MVAGAPAERAWAVLNRQMPDVVCDTDGVPVTPAPAKPLITDNDQRADPGPPPVVAAPRHAPGTGRRTTHSKKGGRPSASRAQRRMTSHTHPDGRTPRGNQTNPLDRQHPISLHVGPEGHAWLSTGNTPADDRLRRRHRRCCRVFFHQVAADAGWRLDWSANPGRRPHRRARPAAAVAPNRSAPGSGPPVHRLDPTTAQDTGGKRRQSTPGRRACVS